MKNLLLNLGTAMKLVSAYLQFTQGDNTDVTVRSLGKSNGKKIGANIHFFLED